MEQRFIRFKDSAGSYARVVADFQAKVILTLLYGVVALPTGLVVRMTEDALTLRRPHRHSYWRTRALSSTRLQDARRQG
ncbi:MAG: hypothetical protein NZ553_11145 [Caldilinea sp.]|nr:hypothetical protein [Caldilinea sp.]MDW8441020.1 hypothetical protein [Caldilineaceae bacterium]